MVETSSLAKELINKAKKEKRTVLLETEGMEILNAMGIETPAFFVVKGILDYNKEDLSKLKGTRVVVKVLSTQILHKSDVGGVVIIDKKQDFVELAISEMEKKFSGSKGLIGFMVCEYIAHKTTLGGELLVGFRESVDFGPVITFAAGGIYTEFLAVNFIKGKEVALFSPYLENNYSDGIKEVAISKILFGGLRGQKQRIEIEKIIEVLELFAGFAKEFVNEISEFEINPLVVSSGRLVALDSLIKLKSNKQIVPDDMKPIEKINNLLHPKTIGVIGVSEKINIGHIIVNNILRSGFKKGNVFIIKPNSETIEGCRCYPDIESLPKKMDLFVLGVSAPQVPEVLSDLVKYEKAESIIVIPGGLEEKAGSEKIVSEMYKVLERSRKSSWRGPVINGGNCVGIKSQPGNYDTMFIPEYKLSQSSAPVAPAALISQSGAFAVARMDLLKNINWKYSISIGNQMDLTAADYLTFLKDDKGIEVFGVYSEGFKPMDGLKFIKAATEIKARGGVVVLYRAGRTQAGQKTAASHTAALASDYKVTRELCVNAGVVVTETFNAFIDALNVFTLLKDKTVAGGRLGAISNAGFECVGVADNLGDLQLSEFNSDTVADIKKIFENAKLSGILDVHNPVDLSPMCNDDVYENIVKSVLADSGVDLGIVGIIPLTSALNTLAAYKAGNAGAEIQHNEDINNPKSIAMRLINLRNTNPKPFVVVVDSGAYYDPVVLLLNENAVPCFRTVDRALRSLNMLYKHKYI